MRKSQPCAGVVTVLSTVLGSWLVVGGFFELSLSEVRVGEGEADGTVVGCVAVRWRAR